MQMFLESHPDQSNAGSFYSQMQGEAYDEFNVRINFTDPYKIVEAISQPAPAEGTSEAETSYGYLNIDRSVAVFDIGQGTGILGRLLRAAGYTNVSGADASVEFCRVATESGNYQSVRAFWFSRGVSNLPAEWVGSFDLVMASGVFLEGHIPAAGFEDAHALCKTGGHFITSMRKQYYVDGHEYGYKEKLDEMVSAGKFAILKTWTFMRGVPNAEDPLFVEMPSFMFVCRRLD